MTDDQIDAIYSSVPMKFPGAEKFHRDFARAVLAGKDAEITRLRALLDMADTTIAGQEARLAYYDKPLGWAG